jgi:putative nucleotidyltransferase with HDIG domain
MDYGRDDAWALVCTYTQNENLRRHMLAVEAAMQAYARRFGQDEEQWAIAGLLHDFDYETFKSAPAHPIEGEKILAEQGWPADIRRAVLSHAEYTGVPRLTPMEKALHACDDITGFVVAVALVRPDRDLKNVAVSSMRKKWKDRSFAGGVDRDEVERAAADLGVPLEEHMAVVLAAMQAIAPALGLAGEPAA